MKYIYKYAMIILLSISLWSGLGVLRKYTDLYAHTFALQREFEQVRMDVVEFKVTGVPPDRLNKWIQSRYVVANPSWWKRDLDVDRVSGLILLAKYSLILLTVLGVVHIIIDGRRLYESRLGGIAPAIIILNSIFCVALLAWMAV